MTDVIQFDLFKDIRMTEQDTLALDAKYEALSEILFDAYLQSAEGKGKVRHANDDYWEDQPICQIGRLVGPGFNAGQAIKKLTEALGMAQRGELDAARNEVLGAIVYAASVVELIDEVRRESYANTADALGYKGCPEDVCGC